MKHIFLIFTVFCFSFIHVPFSKAALPIYISEVQVSGEKANDEFIRLSNENDSVINLAGYKLSKKVLSNGTCKESALVSEKAFIGLIAPHGSFLISHPDYKNKYSADLVYSGNTYYITDNTIILLYDNNRNLIDRKDIGNACDKIAPSPDPDPVPDPPPLPSASHVRFSEVLPNPSSDEEKNEFIELFNPDTFPVSLENFSLKDASKTGQYAFPKGSIIPALGFFVLYRDTFKFALNNSNETLSLLDPTGQESDHISYATTKEGVSLNYDKAHWRGSHFLTPGYQNIYNSLPETKEKVPKKGYVGVPVPFNARGKDQDGDALKYTWNFGDGHRSYKSETTHTYEEKGSYKVSLKTSDGSEDLLESFTLLIESYPKVKVRITALIPNPEGKDSENEWVLVENRGRKTINLKGFSIATGWKNLINHPIHEDFILQPHEERKLTRLFSLFTLPNSKGKVELRAPNGDTLQKIKYKLEKTIEENVTYRKEKEKRWQWKTDDTMTEKNIISESSETSEENAEDKTTIQDARILGEKTEETKKVRMFPVLLNYGTHLHLPSDIILTFPETIYPEENLKDYSPPSSLLDRLNSTLNDWQNE